MKLILIFLFIPILSFSQIDTSKGYIDLADLYTCKGKCDTSVVKIDGYDIQFIYNPELWMDDLVARSKCDSACNMERLSQGLCTCVTIENPKHYFATVRVLKNKRQVGDVMHGYYIKNEVCFDADPEYYLARATKKHKK